MAEDETMEQRTRRLMLEQRTREIADRIKDLLPPDTVFMLFTADVGEDGGLAYVGTSQREDTIAMMREFLHRWGANQ